MFTKKLEIQWKYLSCLAAQPNGSLEWNRGGAPNIWEFFEVGRVQGGKITFLSYHGKYVSAQPDGRIMVDRERALAWEHFHVLDATNTLCPTMSKFTYKITNALRQVIVRSLSISYSLISFINLKSNLDSPSLQRKAKPKCTVSATIAIDCDGGIRIWTHMSDRLEVWKRTRKFQIQQWQIEVWLKK